MIFLSFFGVIRGTGGGGSTSLMRGSDFRGAAAVCDSGLRSKLLFDKADMSKGSIFRLRPVGFKRVFFLPSPVPAGEGFFIAAVVRIGNAAQGQFPCGNSPLFNLVWGGATWELAGKIIANTWRIGNGVGKPLVAEQ